MTKGQAQYQVQPYRGWSCVRWRRKYIDRIFSTYNVDLADFVTADNDAIATANLLNEALSKSAAEEADGSDIDSNNDEPDL